MTDSKPGPESGDEPTEDREAAPAPDLDELNNLVGKLQRAVRNTGTTAARIVGDQAPAWLRDTPEEPKAPVTTAIVAAILLTATLPSRIADRPRWLVPGLAAVLLVGILIVRVNERDTRAVWVRGMGLVLIGLMSIGNAVSAGRLVVDLVQNQGIREPAELLLTGGAIWLTNMILFALWYWEFDRGGPAERAHATHQYPDFLFPQMTAPETAPPDWEPWFVDYLYLSFTDATASSPTDVMPLSRWTKLTMLMQSSISLVLVILVVARAVNVLH